MPFRWNSGRPREKDPMRVVAAWNELGGPEPKSVVLSKVARKCYPEKWQSGDEVTQTKLRKRVLATIRRYQAANDTKPSTVS
jgi:hypothetical protein